MKVYKIIDEARDSILIGYLLSFGHGASFSVELSDDLTVKDSPLFFESFINKGQLTVDPLWSERWVRSRIVPEDRQNLGAVLMDNKLKEYDALKLLMLGSGRCAQDDCAVIPESPARIPEWLFIRRQRKLEYAICIGDYEILSIFRDGSMWRVDPIVEGLADDRLSRICGRPDLMRQMKLIPGGLGVQWQGDIVLTAEQLYGKGKMLPIDHSEFDRLIKYYIMLTPDVCSELDCSRQYINRIVKDGSLQALRESDSVRIYTASEVARFRE